MSLIFGTNGSIIKQIIMNSLLLFLVFEALEPNAQGKSFHMLIQFWKHFSCFSNNPIKHTDPTKKNRTLSLDLYIVEKPRFQNLWCAKCLTRISCTYLREFFPKTQIGLHQQKLSCLYLHQDLMENLWLRREVD